jgi:hypothetical protein
MGVAAAAGASAAVTGSAAGAARGVVAGAAAAGASSAAGFEESALAAAIVGSVVTGLLTSVAGVWVGAAGVADSVVAGVAGMGVAGVTGVVGSALDAITVPDCAISAEVELTDASASAATASKSRHRRDDAIAATLYTTALWITKESLRKYYIKLSTVSGRCVIDRGRTHALYWSSCLMPDLRAIQDVSIQTGLQYKYNPMSVYDMLGDNTVCGRYSCHTGKLEWGCPVTCGGTSECECDQFIDDMTSKNLKCIWICVAGQAPR